jgi:hypothetical protein
MRVKVVRNIVSRTELRGEGGGDPALGYAIISVIPDEVEHVRTDVK